MSLEKAAAYRSVNLHNNQRDAVLLCGASRKFSNGLADAFFQGLRTFLGMLANQRLQPFFAEHFAVWPCSSQPQWLRLYRPPTAVRDSASHRLIQIPFREKHPRSDHAPRAA